MEPTPLDAAVALILFGAAAIAVLALGAYHIYLRVMPEAVPEDEAGWAGTDTPVPPANQYIPHQDAVPAGTAERTATEPVPAPVPAPVGLPNRLSDPELIAFLARLTGPDGKPQYSANKIAAFVGGAREETLAVVRAVRNAPKQASPPRAEGRAIVINGGEREIAR